MLYSEGEEFRERGSVTEKVVTCVVRMCVCSFFMYRLFVLCVFMCVCGGCVACVCVCVCVFIWFCS